MPTDFRGLAVSTRSDRALAAYETALASLNTYTGDPIAAIDQAIAADGDFVLAHLFKALALFTTSERRFLPMAGESLARAQALAPAANARETALTAATARLVAGDWHGACAAFDRIIAGYPHDILAIQIAHLVDFYRGDALNLRNRVARALAHWSRDVPGYSYVLGMYAFGLEEMNQYADAERAGRAALELQPRDGWSVHAVTHVMEMQGRVTEGIAWLTSRESDWAPDNSFAPHNWWHLALFHLDRGDYDAALALFDARLMGPQADMVLVLLDATALLWRLRLEGVDVGDRLGKVADLWQGKLDVEPGFYAFNDVHALMSLADAGRDAAVAGLLAKMRAAAGGSDANAAMTRDVGLPLAEGLLAFARGRHAEAIAAIEPVRDVAHRFGGSHAQRDLLTLTLIEAGLRGGDAARAQLYLAERQMLKPTAWSERLATRLRAHQDGRLRPALAVEASRAQGSRTQS